MKALLLLSLFAHALPAAAAPAKEKTPPPAVLVTVDGVPIKRTEVLERAFKDYGTAALNAIVDELLVRNTAGALGVKPDAKEVAARLARMREQFKDEATFAERLNAAGTSLEEVKGRVEEQALREALLIKARGLQVTDAELKEFFEANKEKLGTPEAVKVRHLQVASEREAGDFAIALRAGADFGALARQASLDAGTKERGGDLGFVARGMLAPELESVVFSLKPGEVAAPVKTAAGFHLLKVEERQAAKAAVLSEIQENLRRALLAEKINKAWPAYIQELREKARLEPGK